MKRRQLLGTSLGALFCVFGLSSAPSAWALDKPKGKVILSISGKIEVQNQGNLAVLDLAMLQKLPQHSFSTQTPWDSKPTAFTGPLLRDVLAAVKATGSTLEATALNDYKINLPVSDASQYDVVIAHTMNGDVIPVSTKGPLFIVYPFDSKAELKAVKYYERSIWQLKSLTVK